MKPFVIKTLRFIQETARFSQRTYANLFRLNLKDIQGPMPEVDYQGQEANYLIRSWLEDDAPFMAARLGAKEANTTIRYLNIQEKVGSWIKLSRYLFKRSGPFWWDDEIRKEMQINTGFFPTDDEHLAHFGERMVQDLPIVDILGSSIPGREVRLMQYFQQAKIIPLPDLEPYYHNDPWSQALKGKKVLVVHPYETSIKNQYARRKKLFQDPKVLPEFELLTLKAVQSIAGNPVGYESWFDALDWMCDQIAKMDYEVAIIGAGAYGLPLAAFVKRMGKKAIHLGGPTQILFGIRGQRWDDREFFQKLYNEFWMRPLPEEIPENYQAVEGGCYW